MPTEKTSPITGLPTRLREDCERALKAIAADRKATQEAATAAEKLLAEAKNTHIVAGELAAAAAADVQQLAEEIATGQAALDGEVQQAQAEFDAALASSAQAAQLAAERLYVAKSKQSAGSERLGGLRLRMQVQQDVANRAAAERDGAREDVVEAEKNLSRAESDLAVIACDEAQVHALAAWLAVNRRHSRLSPTMQTRALEQVSFWFSDARRAPRWNAAIGHAAQGTGPVLWRDMYLEILAKEARE